MKGTKEMLAEAAAKLHASRRMEWQEIYHNLLNTNSRLREVARSRQWVGYMLYNFCGLTTTQSAKELGLDHSTIIYYIENINADLKFCKRAQFKLDVLRKVLNGVKVDIPLPKETELKSFYSLSETDEAYLIANANKESITIMADTLKKSRRIVRQFVKPLLKKYQYSKSMSENQSLYALRRNIYAGSVE